MTPVTSPLARGAFRNSTAQRGFSLIEVVLAVGVVAFAFVAILGLIPAGMGQFRQAIDTSVCAQIAQRVINDAQQAEYATLIDEKNLPVSLQNFAFRMPTVALSDSNHARCMRYFDEQGNEVIPTNPANNTFSSSATDKALQAKVTYYVNVRVVPNGIIPSGNGQFYYGPHMATLTIQVAYNPGNLPITVSSSSGTSSDPLRKLWIKTPGINMITYNAQIARY
jgi:uncharacterized protein (TIGR02598 family)